MRFVKLEILQNAGCFHIFSGMVVAELSDIPIELVDIAKNPRMVSV